MLNSGRDINNIITINETPDQPQFQNLQHEKLRASHLHAPLLKAALMADVLFGYMAKRAVVNLRLQNRWQMNWTYLSALFRLVHQLPRLILWAIVMLLGNIAVQHIVKHMKTAVYFYLMK